MSAQIPSTSSRPADRKRRRWLVEIALFIAVLLGIQVWQSRDVPSGPAPDFSAMAADGTRISLAEWRARHPGQAVALYFWADWCPVCTAQQGNIDAVQAAHPVLTVAMQSGDAAAVGEILAQRDLDWVTAVDGSGSIAARYGLHGVPAFITITAEGRIRSVAIGYTTRLGMYLRLWWAGLGGAGAS